MAGCYEFRVPTSFNGSDFRGPSTSSRLGWLGCCESRVLTSSMDVQSPSTSIVPQHWRQISIGGGGEGGGKGNTMAGCDAAFVTFNDGGMTDSGGERGWHGAAKRRRLGACTLSCWSRGRECRGGGLR